MLDESVLNALGTPPPGGPWRLDYEDVALCLKQLAEESPDHLYDRRDGALGCLYAHGGQPGCIVGHVIARLLPDFPLAALNNAAGTNSAGARVALPHVGIRCDRWTLDLLEAVQIAQDRREPWGRAVELAFDRTAGRGA